MKKYQSNVIVMRNGSRITDFKNYKKGAVTHATVVDLMDGPGVVDNTSGYPFSIDYVPPAVNPKLDWTDVQEETWVITPKSGGTKTVYTGVKFLDEGESTYDGKTEGVLPLNFIAKTRNFE